MFYNIIIAVCVISIIGFNIFTFFKYNKTVSFGKWFNTSNYAYSIGTAYLTEKDYKGDEIDSNYKYLILKLEASPYTESKLLASKFIIESDNVKYQSIDYNTKFKDLGKMYNNESLTEYSIYLLVYELPKDAKNYKLTYQDYKTTYNIKLKITDLDNSTNETIYNLADTVEFNNTTLAYTNFGIYSYEVGNRVKSYYDFTYKDETFSSYEYISPNLNSNIDKAILKLQYSYYYDNGASAINISNFYKFLQNYGTLVYTIGDEEYTFKFKYEKITPTKATSDGTIYIEVPRSVVSADSIKIKINVRNDTFLYQLK